MVANFRLALPIAHIYSLDKVTKIREGGGLPDARNLIFDVVKKAVIKVVPERTFSVTSDLRSNPIELHDILVDPLPVFHGEVVELVFSISDRVKRTKVGLGLQDELLEVILPKQSESRILCEQEVRFKPFQGHTFQVQLREGNFSMPHMKSFGTVLKIKLDRRAHV